MSGIAVVYNLDGSPAGQELVGAMLDAIAWRGPDGIASRVQGPVALGHAMLRTTPESVHETQPLVDERAGLALVMDGRVDNRDELKDALEGKGARLGGDTDAEIVLRAYQCWGEESPDRIVGDFAYAVWDARKQQLFCARDPMGVRSFYYYCDSRVFMGGSELHQMLVNPAVPREPDEAVMGVYLTGMLLDSATTLYRGIFKLPGGHSMTVRPSGVSRRRYFNIDPSRKIRHCTDAEYAEHFISLFREAVRCRLRSIDGVASELSGGLDSSLVVGVVQTMLRGGTLPGLRFETFSMKFDDPECDERTFIRDVSAMWGTETNWADPYIAEFPHYIDSIRRYRHFCGYPNSVMDEPLRAAMRKRGYRVVLTGQGGDQWFSGSYDYLADLLLQLKLGELDKLVRLDSGSHDISGLNRSYLKIFVSRALMPILPTGVRLLINQLRGIRLVPRFVNPEVARRLGLEWRRTAGPAFPSNRLSFAQRNMFMTFVLGQAAHFCELEERESAAAGLEARHPFYDRRIIEFAFAIPEEQRYRPGLTKCVMREAGKGLMPESVRQRLDKAEFSAVQIEGLRKVVSGLGGEDAFASFDLASRGWIDPAVFRQVYEKRMGDSARANLWQLWSVLEVEMWLREAFQKNEKRS